MSPLPSMPTDDVLALFAAYIHEWMPQKRAELQTQRDRLAKRADPAKQARPEEPKAAPAGSSFWEIAFAGQETRDVSSPVPSAISDEAVPSEAIAAGPMAERIQEMANPEAIPEPVAVDPEPEQPMGEATLPASEAETLDPLGSETDDPLPEEPASLPLSLSALPDEDELA